MNASKVILFPLIMLAIGVHSSAHCVEVALSELSGARIDANWFRYANLRFGVAVDIPSHGYRYDIPINGSGLSLTSKDGAVVITINTHWVVSILHGANNDVQRSISQIFDNKISGTLQENGSITYSVKKDDFYVISGNFARDTYYERLIISPRCPAIFNALRIFHPKEKERALGPLVTRMSKSLTATCQGEEGAVRFK